MNDQDFLHVYEQNADPIFRFCYFRLRDREEAKDVTQETFLRVWEYLSRGRKVENIRAFLYKVAGNRVIDVLRKSGRTTSIEELSDNGFDPKDENATNVMDSIDGARALEQTKNLPDIYKEVILLRFVEGFSIKEISDVVNESENVISVRLHRALGKLKKLCKLGEAEPDKKENLNLNTVSNSESKK